jgi:hypothetical protein
MYYRVKIAWHFLSYYDMLALNQCFGSGSTFDGRLDPDSDSEGLKRAKKKEKRSQKTDKSYKKAM